MKSGTGIGFSESSVEATMHLNTLDNSTTLGTNSYTDNHMIEIGTLVKPLNFLLLRAFDLPSMNNKVDRTLLLFDHLSSSRFPHLPFLHLHKESLKSHARY